MAGENDRQEMERAREAEAAAAEAARRAAEEAGAQAAADTDGTDDAGGLVDPSKARGTISDQPEAVSRADRTEHAQTPGEEREAMYKRMRDRRDAQRGAPPPLSDDDGTGVGADDGGEMREPAPDQPPAGKFKLRINHQDHYVDYDELTRLAQIGAVAPNIMDNAKAQAHRIMQDALAEATRIRQDAVSRPDSAHQADADDVPGPRTKGRTLAEIAEALQAGDTDEATQAIGQLRADILAEIRAEQPALSSEDVAAEAEARIEARQADARFRAWFAREHAELTGRRGLQLELQDRLHQEAVNELRSVIANDGGMHTDAQLMPAMRDPAKALEWLGFYSQNGYRRQDGKPLANPLEVMDRAARQIKTEYHLVPPQQTALAANANRQQQVRQEKRNLSEPRPTSTGARQATGQPQRPSPEQKRASAVAARRQATGFDRIT